VSLVKALTSIEVSDLCNELSKQLKSLKFPLERLKNLPKSTRNRPQLAPAKVTRNVQFQQKNVQQQQKHNKKGKLNGERAKVIEKRVHK
jgi:hypothetical protein